MRSSVPPNYMMTCYFILGMIMLVARVQPAASQTLTTGAPPLFSEYTVLMERLQRSELERLKALMEIERLQDEMRRLDSQRAEATQQVQRLEDDLRRMSARLAAASAAAMVPRTPVMAMVETSLRRIGTTAPPARVNAMTIAIVGEPAFTAAWLRISLRGETFLADPSDWATETEILRRLQERREFIQQQIAMAPDQPDGPATDRLERYELQLERLGETIRSVQHAFQHYRSGSAPPTVSPR